MENSPIWMETADYVKTMLSQAEKGDQMMEFVELMCTFYETKKGCNPKQIEELRQLMAALAFSYMRILRAKQEKVLETKKMLYDPKDEVCLILKRAHLPRVLGLIKSRNKQLKEPEERLRQPTSEKGQITYRLLD